MDTQEYGLAKDLARQSIDLDQVVRKFVIRVVSSTTQPKAVELGIHFSRVEGEEYVFTAQFHRKIIDVEFENAIYEDQEDFDKSLIARVKLFLRTGRDERVQLPCTLFMSAAGDIHLLRGVVVDIHDAAAMPSVLTTIVDHVSEVIVKVIHPTLVLYAGREDIA